MQAVICTNEGCTHNDGYCRCDCMDLVIKDCACMGSALHGRNVTSDDIVVKLRVKNYKLRAFLHKAERENAELKEELKEIRPEYEWQREFLNRMADHCGKTDSSNLVVYMNKLESENARLHELVLGIWRTCPTDERDCAKCEHVKIDDSGEYPSYGCDFYDRIRELGIEVDE